MKRPTILTIAVAIGVGLITSAANAANIMSNPSFETGIGVDPTDWYHGANGDSWATWIHDDGATGTNSYELGVGTQGAGNDSDLRSAEAPIGGATNLLFWYFSYSFRTNSSGNLSGTPDVHVRYFDASHGWLGQAHYTFGSGVTNMAGWETIPAQTATAAGGTVYIDVWFNADEWSAFEGVFRIDDVVVDIIPEPLAPVLAGLAVLALRFRR